MIAKFLSLTFVFALCSGLATAQPDPKPVADKKLVTKLYNIKHLIGERGKASGLADADAVIKVLLETFPQLRDLKPGTDGPQIVERDGNKLAIRTTEEVHGEIKDLLEALERLQDLAVDVKAEVIELDAVAFAKLQKVLAKGNVKPPVLFAMGEEIEDEKKLEAAEKVMEEANKILKAGLVVQTSSGRFLNGAEATISARQSVLTYTNHLETGFRETPLFMKEGFTLVAVPVVSADRRFIRFKLTEQSTVVTGMKKKEFEENGAKIIAQSPVVEDFGATGSAVVADGSTILFRLAYAPKDKVWVVVVKPTIYIRAEEEELNRLRLKRWFDFFLGR